MLGENHPDSKVLDGPAISGIVIGIVILLISGLFLCRCIYRRKQRQRKENQDGGITPLPYEITRRGRRSKPRTGMTSSSTTDLLPGGSNENPGETYPITSYPLNPRNRIARM
ncbi:hypothetical protein CPB86DRAFT_362301 [Serendipita vermifera]|nr:hypothetical protein CPB86DRAFT_362301 [Serendipita vermifera]